MAPNMGGVPVNVPRRRNRAIRRLRARLHHGQQSYKVIAPFATGRHLGMVASGQIQLTIVRHVGRSASPCQDIDPEVPETAGGVA